jgi:hypothetical protein
MRPKRLRQAKRRQYTRLTSRNHKSSIEHGAAVAVKLHSRDHSGELLQ